MTRVNLVPLLRRNGWGLAMLDPKTKKPAAFLNRKTKSYSGLLTLDSIFDRKIDIIQEYKHLKSLSIPCEIVQIEHTYFNANISIKVLRDFKDKE